MKNINSALNDASIIQRDGTLEIKGVYKTIYDVKDAFIKFSGVKILDSSKEIDVRNPECSFGYILAGGHNPIRMFTGMVCQDNLLVSIEQDLGDENLYNVYTYGNVEETRAFLALMNISL